MKVTLSISVLTEVTLLIEMVFDLAWGDFSLWGPAQQKQSVIFQVGTQRKMSREGKYASICKVNDTQIYPSDQRD